MYYFGRELGDIKALLMADRAHRRDNAGSSSSNNSSNNSNSSNNERAPMGAQRGALENNDSQRPRLLTSSKGRSSSEQFSDRSSDRFQAPPDDSSVIDASLSAAHGADGGSAIEEWGNTRGRMLRDDMVYMPPVLLSAREVGVLELLLQGCTNR